MQGAAAEAYKMKITICPSLSCPAAFDLQLIAAPPGIRVKKYIQETELSVDPFHLFGHIRTWESGENGRETSGSEIIL